MKTKYCAALMVAAFVFLLPLSARSEIREGTFELGAFGGYNFFQNKQNLKDRPEFGGRLGYNFTKNWGIEGVAEFIKTGVDDKNISGVKEGQFGSPMDGVNIAFYHLDAVYHFMPDGKFNPFVVAGFGGAHYSPKISDHDMAAFNVGLGAKYWVTDRVALRGDLRDYIVTEIMQETYHNFGATVGITLAFGGKAKPEPKPEPVKAPPPAAAPTVSIYADPATIEQNKCTKLAWSTTGASSASIDQGIGNVDPNGFRQVCPGNTTQYTITAMGDGGTRTGSTTVTVNPPPPPPAAAPTVSIYADPATIEQNKCTKLAWSTTGASSASIDQGIGNVDPNGFRQVCPGNTTQYTITAMGDGGTRTGSTTVTVNPPPPPPAAPKPAPKVIDRLVLHVNFDFDKSDVRKADVAELQKAIVFVKKYPGYKIDIEGHTDSRGSDKYNQALSERRAASVKDYLLKHGMIDTPRDEITTRGHGESKPIADNSTDKGRFENRRVEILILEK